MKKKLLFLSLSVLAIAAVVTVKSINTKSGMSSLMTQNIEALTQGEDTPSYDCPGGMRGCVKINDRYYFKYLF